MCTISFTVGKSGFLDEKRVNVTWSLLYLDLNWETLGFCSTNRGLRSGNRVLNSHFHWEVVRSRCSYGLILFICKTLGTCVCVNWYCHYFVCDSASNQTQHWDLFTSAPSSLSPPRSVFSILTSSRSFPSFIEDFGFFQTVWHQCSPSSLLSVCVIVASSPSGEMTLDSKPATLLPYYFTHQKACCLQMETLCFHSTNEADVL